jgi:hypothetical protein
MEGDASWNTEHQPYKKTVYVLYVAIINSVYQYSATSKPEFSELPEFNELTVPLLFLHLG